MNSRTEFANQLEMLMSKSISIDEFENIFFQISKEMKKSKDSNYPLVKDVFWQVWQLYDDLSDDFLHVEGVDIEHMSRWICFLLSERPYEWPPIQSSGIRYLFLGTFFDCIRRKRLKQHGDLNYWPFLSKKEYQRARKLSSL